MSAASRIPFCPLLVAVAALAATLATLGPEGNGPGVTCDEPYHVNQGKELVTALRHQGLAFFLPANIQRNFDWPPPPDGLPVQAPLGHWILGWTHWLMDPAPDDPLLLSIAAARFAPAVAFALLALMVGWWTARREGALAGTVAAAAVALMPRLFAHAHLAALDMLTTLCFVTAVLAVTEAARGGRAWHFPLAGVVWGAAMLVRLHGLLVAPPVLLWLLWHFWQQKPTGCNPGAWKGFLWPLTKAAAAWLAGGGVTLFLGWPWLWPTPATWPRLWLTPLAHFRQYVASGPVRLPLHVFYWGHVWTDRNVPWHYPWVTFAVTVPVGLLALGMVGLWVGLRRGRASVPVTLRVTPAPHAEREEYVLVAATMLFLLAVFSWPGTPVYDGERLFLMVFPLWAVWVGIGARRLVAPGGSRRAWRTVAVLALVAIQGIGLVAYHPCQLSYYNLLVGGLAGAEKLGFEVTYWGDAVREPMLAEAARRSPGRPVLFAPNLAQYQAPAVEISSPALRTTGVHLIGWGESGLDGSARRCRYAVIYHRRADLAEAASWLERGRVVIESTRQGVWLARLIELPPSTHPPDGVE